MTAMTAKLSRRACAVVALLLVVTIASKPPLNTPTAEPRASTEPGAVHATDAGPHVKVDRSAAVEAPAGSAADATSTSATAGAGGPSGGVLRPAVAFEPNRGQSPAGLFVAPLAGGSVSLDRSGLTVTVDGAELAPSSPAGAPGVVERPVRLPQRAAAQALRLRFAGASPAVRLAPSGRLPGVVHYMQGNDPSRWRRNVPTFAGVTYRGIYPGVDVRWDGPHGALKATWTVSPGTDPAVIGWSYGAGTTVTRTPSGDLAVRLPGGARVVDRAPVAWQDGPAGREPVDVAFQVTGSRVGFTVGTFDRARPLVIDPELVFSGPVGPPQSLFAPELAERRDGSWVMAGMWWPPGKPFGDAVVVVMSREGVITSRTVFGGSGTDAVFAVAVDARGRAYVGGSTDSRDLPVRAADQPRRNEASSDAFVLALDPDRAVLHYATYLGGSSGDRVEALAVQPAGTVAVGGVTNSRDFPLREPLETRPQFGNTGFLAVYDGAGRRLRSTYLGGHGISVTSPGVFAIEPDPRDQTGFFIGGSAHYCVLPARVAVACPPGREAPPELPGVPEPARSAVEDMLLTATVGTVGYVARLADSGRRIEWVAYLGGTTGAANRGLLAGTWIYDLAVSSRAPEVTAVGATTVADLPATDSAVQPTYGGGGYDGFVATVSGEGLHALTYLGGTGNDVLRQVALDTAGRTVLAGITDSQDFPTARPIQPRPAGGSELVVARLTRSAQLIDSTYFGGSGNDQDNVALLLVRDDPVVAVTTRSPDFPTRNASRPLAAPRDTVMFRLRFDPPCPTSPRVRWDVGLAACPP